MANVTQLISGLINSGLNAVNNAFYSHNTLLSNTQGFVGNNQGKDASVRIEQGEVTFIYGYSGLCDVRLSGHNTLMCFSLQETTSGPLGVQTNSLLIPGTKVWVMSLLFSDGNQKGRPWGVVLGSTQTMPEALDIPHYRVPGFMGGVYGDKIHQYQYTNGMKNNLLSFGSGRLVDILAGEWAKSGTFGTFVTVEHFAATLGVSAMCGIFAYYFNNLLRVAGSIIKQETDASESWKGLVEREAIETDFRALYPWEALGADEFSTDPIKDETKNLKLGEGSLPLEPLNGVNQRGIWRDVILGNYLGDVHHRFVNAPFSISGGVNQRGQNYKGFAGLFHEHIGSDGSYSVSSAKEIILRKTIMIPAILPQYDPLDPEGDSEVNQYAPSGVDEKTSKTADKAYKKRYDWNSDSKQPGMSKVSRLPDYHAYLFYKYFVQTVNNHEKSWYLQNAEDSSLVSRTTTYKPKVSEKAWLPAPAPVRVKLDHRTDKTENNAEYYRTEAGIHMLDDGGVMLSDGYGSEVILSGGNITISCPGDVWVRPGRSLISWAPRDVVLRAGNSVDITASKRDVRIKAEKNLLMLSHKGGTLIESRGPYAKPDKSKEGEAQTLSGVVIKSTKSTTELVGADVYIKSTGPTDKPGITIDAGNSRNVLMLHRALQSVGFNFQMALGQTATIGPDGAIANAKIYNFDSSIAYMPGNLNIEKYLSTSPGGGAYIGGQLAVESNILGKGGMSVLQSVQSSSTMMGQHDGESRAALTEGLSAIKTQITETKKIIDGVGIDNIAAQKFTPELKKVLDENGPGNLEYLKGFGFSFRKPEEYLTKIDVNEFKLWLSKWQQYADKTWDEPVVKGPDPSGSLEGMPHPGKESWEGSTLQTVTLKNVTDDMPKKKTEITADVAAVTPKAMKSEYKVSMQEST